MEKIEYKNISVEMPERGQILNNVDVVVYPDRFVEIKHHDGESICLGHLSHFILWLEPQNYDN